MKKSHLIYLLIISICFVLITPFFTYVEVQNDEELRNMEFGFPISYVKQDLSSFSPPFPWSFSINSPWEHPTKILFINLSVSIILVYSILVLMMRSIVMIFMRSR